jgi:hypothetical protein
VELPGSSPAAHPNNHRSVRRDPAVTGTKAEAYGPVPTLVVVGASGGRRAHISVGAPVRGGPVPRCTPSSPWMRAGEPPPPRSSGAI